MSNEERGFGDFFERIFGGEVEEERESVEPTPVANLSLDRIRVVNGEKPTIAAVHEFITSSGVDNFSKINNRVKFGAGIKPDDWIEIPIWYVDLPSVPITEKQVEDAIVASLNRYDISTSQQVSCDFGRIDIETYNEVCEVKVNCDRDSLYHAIGQLIVYTYASSLRDYAPRPKDAVLFAYAATSSNIAGVYNIMYAAQKMGVHVYLVVRRHSETVSFPIEMMKEHLAELVRVYREDNPDSGHVDVAELAMERMRLNLIELNKILLKRKEARDARFNQ